MAAPTDPTINDRIALAKGWRRVAYDDNRFHQQPFYWVDNANVVRGEQLPDFVGTLEGVSGLMRELNEQAGYRQYWVWGSNAKELFTAPPSAYYCARHSLQQRYLEWFVSDSDRPGDCVGQAYMSVKETD